MLLVAAASRSVTDGWVDVEAVALEAAPVAAPAGGDSSACRMAAEAAPAVDVAAHSAAATDGGGDRPQGAPGKDSSAH